MNINRLILLVLFYICGESTKAQIPNWQWARGDSGIKNSDKGNSIYTDANGNSYITGSIGSPTVSFGNTNLFNTVSNSSLPSLDIFIAKYDVSGTLVCAKNFGGSSDDSGSSICVDAMGNCYITGSFNSPVISIGNFRTEKGRKIYF